MGPGSDAQTADRGGRAPAAGLLLVALVAMTGCGSSAPSVTISAGTPARQAEALLLADGWEHVSVGIKLGRDGSFWVDPDRAFAVISYRDADGTAVVDTIERGKPGTGYLGKEQWNEHDLRPIGQLTVPDHGQDR